MPLLCFLRLGEMLVDICDGYHGPPNEVSFANGFQPGCIRWIAEKGVYKTDGLIYIWELKQIVYNMFELFCAHFYGGVGLFVGCFIG